MFKKKTLPKVVAVSSSPGVAGVPGSSIPVSQEELTLANSEFNVHKITDIQNRFHGGVELLVPGRIFVREGTLVKVCRKGPKPRQFFLFNDILIYGTILPTKGRYAAQHVMDLEHMTVTSDCHFMPSVYTAHSTELDVDSENAFQVNHMEKSFHVFASSLADKSNWIHNLKKYIAKRTAGKQDSASMAMKAVWVPDDRVNHCMGCECKFTTFNRKHHCRFCGKVVCSDCSPHRVDVSTLRGAVKPTGKVERVCKECFLLSQSDPHKGRSPPISPSGSPKSSMRSKPTVIDSRPGTSPDSSSSSSVLTQAGFTGPLTPDEDSRTKRPAPVRPPPPGSPPPVDLVRQAKERRGRMDTFDRRRNPDPKTSPAAAEDEDEGMGNDGSEAQFMADDDDDARGDGDGCGDGGDESSSDSDDSAEIDLDDVEEADPFTMQRANSESPLHGSLSDEGLGAICQKIQTNIRISTVDPGATDEELAELMAQSVAEEPAGIQVICGQCSKKCVTGEFGKLRDEFFCSEHFIGVVRSSQQIDTSSVSKPATQLSDPKPAGRQAPIRPSRPARPENTATSSDGGQQPMKPKPRQRIATGAEKAEGSAAPAKEEAIKGDVDSLLTMSPEEQQPASDSSTLVTLATDPPGLSNQPLVPIPTSAVSIAEKEKATPPPAKRSTERRKKKFKSSTAPTETTPLAEAIPAAAAPSAEPALDPAKEEPADEGNAQMFEETDSGRETAAIGDLVDLSDSTPASHDIAASSSLQSPDTAQSGDLLDFGEAEGGGSPEAKGKVRTRAEKRKNKFKKKEG